MENHEGLSYVGSFVCFLPAPLLAPATHRSLPPHHCCDSWWLRETHEDGAEAALSWSRRLRHQNSWVPWCPLELRNALETHQVAICIHNNLPCESLSFSWCN